MRPPDATGRRAHGLEVRPVDRFGSDMDELGARAAAGYGSHFSRDAAYFNWRYLDSPRDYRCFGAYRGGDLVGVGVVGHTFKHGVSAGFLADLVAVPDDGATVRALVARAVQEVKGGADALVLLPPPSTAHRRALVRAGFAPTTEEASLHRQGAPRRCPSRRARRSVALHARRLRLLLMPKLVFITQQVDPAHPALAATVPKIRALAELVDEVVVLADAAVEGSASGELPCAYLSRRSQGCCAACASRRRSRASWLACAAEPSSRTCARSTQCSPRRSCGRSRIPLVLWFTHWRTSSLLASRRARLDGGHDRRRAIVPVPLEQAPGDRARHRPRGVPVLACARRERDTAARARALLDGEGARRRGRGGAARRTRRGAARATARPSTTRSARIERSSSSSSASSSSEGASPSGTPFREARSRRSWQRTTRS